MNTEKILQSLSEKLNNTEANVPHDGLNKLSLENLRNVANEVRLLLERRQDGGKLTNLDLERLRNLLLLESFQRFGVEGQEIVTDALVGVECKS